MIILEFPILPISVNKLYMTRFGQSRRFLTTEGRKFKETINEKVKEALQDEDTLSIVSSFVGKPLEVTVEITSKSWLLKDRKTIKRKDVSNGEKALNDSIFDAFSESNIPLDDSQIWKISLRKIVTETEEDSTRVTIKHFEETV